MAQDKARITGQRFIVGLGLRAFLKFSVRDFQGVWIKNYEPQLEGSKNP